MLLKLDEMIAITQRPDFINFMIERKLGGRLLSDLYFDVRNSKISFLSEVEGKRVGLLIKRDYNIMINNIKRKMKNVIDPLKKEIKEKPEKFDELIAEIEFQNVLFIGQLEKIRANFRNYYTEIVYYCSDYELNWDEFLITNFEENVQNLLNLL